MEDSEIKKIRKDTFQQIKIAEKKYENASILINGQASVDAIPILHKAVDIAVSVLLNLKQKSIDDFQKNINSLKEEYKKEGILDEKTLKIFHSLSGMYEDYKSEIELKYNISDIKEVFEKTGEFLVTIRKYLKTRLTTSKEQARKNRASKILTVCGVLIVSSIVILLLVNLGIKIFGPKHGFLAHYYDNIDLKGPTAVEKIDGKIDFRWGRSSPHPKITDNFSVRWEGELEIDKSDHYTFYINSDEGTKLFLDDELIIDTWLNKNRPVENAGELFLEEGVHKIKLEYFFDQRHAHIKLLWSSGSFKKRTMKSKFLTPPID